MTRDQAVQEQIDYIMDTFDFHHVAEVYDRMGYTWYGGSGESHSPDQYEIRQEARKMLREAADRREGSFTGRLMVVYKEGTDADGPWLKLALYFAPMDAGEDGTSYDP